MLNTSFKSRLHGDIFMFKRPAPVLIARVFLKFYQHLSQP